MNAKILDKEGYVLSVLNKGKYDDYSGEVTKKGKARKIIFYCGEDEICKANVRKRFNHFEKLISFLFKIIKRNEVILNTVHLYNGDYLSLDVSINFK